MPVEQDGTVILPSVGAVRVADLTVRAVLANRFAVRTPWLVKFTPALRALLPRRAFNAVAAAFGVNTSMMEWRGRR